MGHADDTPRALTCRELNAFVVDYLDDALPLADRAAFEAHLAACEDCLVYLRSYRAAVALGKTYGDPAADPPPMPEELVQAILAARRKS